MTSSPEFDSDENGWDPKTNSINRTNTWTGHISGWKGYKA